MKDLLAFLKYKFSDITSVHYEHLLKPELTLVEEGHVTLTMVVLPEHSNIAGIVHGGVFAGLADIAMGLTCLSMQKQVVTTDMNISYIRNVVVGDTVTVQGYLLQAGRQLMRTRCEIYSGDTLLVSATGTFFVTGAVALHEKTKD